MGAFIYDITYIDGTLVVHETIVADSVVEAVEKFNLTLISGYVDILGVLELDLPAVMKQQAM